MIEINKRQFLSFDYINRIKILKQIIKGNIKYTTKEAEKKKYTKGKNNDL